MVSQLCWMAAALPQQGKPPFSVGRLDSFLLLKKLSS